MAGVTALRGCASVGPGQTAFDDITGPVEIDHAHQPDEKNRGVYDSLFDALLTIYRNNRSLYEKLNRSPA